MSLKITKVLLLGLGLYIVYTYSSHLIANRPNHIREVDTQGYFLIGRSLSNFEIPSWKEDYFKYRSHVYVENELGEVTAKYTPGWPLLLALGYAIDGVDGAMWVNIISGIIGALCFFALAWILFGPAAAVVCSAIFLSSAHLASYVAYPLAHSTDITMVIASFLGIVLWAKNPRPAWAALAGFLTAYMCLVRPVNVLLFPACAWMFFVIKREGIKEGGDFFRNQPRQYLFFTLGWLVPIIFWSIYNTYQFGLPWLTGYAMTREQMGFDFSTFLERVPEIFPKRGYYLTDILWTMCIIGLCHGIVRYPARCLALFLWTFPLLYLYVCYYWYTPKYGTAYTRFFLSIFPAVVLCVGFLFNGLRDKAWPQILTALVLCFWVWIHPPDLAIDRLEKLNRDRGAEIFNVLRTKVEGDAVIYTPIHLSFHASVVEGFEAYPFQSWLDSRYCQPYNLEKALKLSPWHDVNRLKKVHEHYAKIGAKSLRQHMREHAMEQLKKGNKIFIVDYRRGKWTHAHFSKSEEFKLRPMDLNSKRVNAWQVELPSP